MAYLLDQSFFQGDGWDQEEETGNSRVGQGAVAQHGEQLVCEQGAFNVLVDEVEGQSRG